IEHSEELLAFYGEDPFAADRPVAMKGKLEAVRSSGSEAIAHAVAESWMEELGFPFDGVSIEISDEPGIGLELDESASIELGKELVADEQTLLASVALAMSGIFLALDRPEEGEGWSEAEESPIHALVAVLLGMGPYLCNRAIGYDPANAAVEIGMDLQELCFAQAYLTFVFDQDFTAFQEWFAPEARTLVGEALEYLKTRETSAST
ncbi:MAG: hypothetical protein KDK37_17230, partial [Leptospiraceae bacterium]|nr:hypothetical protein [Leptospiraceae bacterium]